MYIKFEEIKISATYRQTQGMRAKIWESFDTGEVKTCIQSQFLLGC